MLEILQQIDSSLFFFINGTLANPVTDFLMPLFTNDWGLRVGYGLAMILCLSFGNVRLRWMVLFSVIVLVLTDQIAANFLKDLIGRIRPCHTFDADSINLLVHCGGGKSMPSAHASNAFGQGIFFSIFYKQVRPYLLIYAILVALSRVFVGVHYPFDILAGALIGTLIAVVVALLYKQFARRVLKNDAVQN